MTLAACAACAASDSTIDVTHDVCAPVALAAPGADPVQLAGVAAAIELWAPRGAAEVALAAPAAIELRFEPAALAFRGVYDDEASIIYINRAITEPRALAIVIAHELGHAFGLEHVDRDAAPSVMNPGNLEVAPTAADQHLLEARWGRCE